MLRLPHLINGARLVHYEGAAICNRLWKPVAVTPLIKCKCCTLCHTDRSRYTLREAGDDPSLQLPTKTAVLGVNIDDRTTTDKPVDAQCRPNFRPGWRLKHSGIPFAFWGWASVPVGIRRLTNRTKHPENDNNQEAHRDRHELTTQPRPRWFMDSSLSESRCNLAFTSTTRKQRGGCDSV